MPRSGRTTRRRSARPRRTRPARAATTSSTLARVIIRALRRSAAPAASSSWSVHASSSRMSTQSVRAASRHGRTNSPAQTWRAAPRRPPALVALRPTAAPSASAARGRTVQRRSSMLRTGTSPTGTAPGRSTAAARMRLRQRTIAHRHRRRARALVCARTLRLSCTGAARRTDRGSHCPQSRAQGAVSARPL